MAQYCIDTSALIQAWFETYPKDVFPSFWERFEQAIDSRLIIAPEEVLYELEKKEDALHKWVKQRHKLFLPLDEHTQAAAMEVLAKFERLAGAGKNKTAADSFVVGLAKLKRCHVVTAEKNGNPNRPKIPFVCNEFSVECLDLLGMIRALKWNF